ncbi:hypothetical protein ID866_9565 [Astraeus odoratus]|nr:hypothetical protein ID866_9565 [Astraeus odoratus]
MLAASASLLNVDTVILGDGEMASAKQVIAPRSPSLARVDGSVADPAKIRELATKVDVLMVENEHVDASVLEEIASDLAIIVHPSPSTIKVIQDKVAQQSHLSNHGCPVLGFTPVDTTVESIHQCAQTLGLPFMLKSRMLADDDREIAVVVVHTTGGEVVSYLATETVHKDNICHLVFAPLRSRDPQVAVRAQGMAESAVKTLEGAGIFGVEMFLMEDGSIYINEIVPHPHDSGHYTMEGCYTSQFDNHLHAILSLPLGLTALSVLSAAMLNIISASSSMDDIDQFVSTAFSVPGCTVHLYGKSECRKGCKMGHVTITGDLDATV